MNSSVNPGNNDKLALSARRSAVSMFNARYSVAAIATAANEEGRCYSYEEEPVSPDKEIQREGSVH